MKRFFLLIILSLFIISCGEAGQDKGFIKIAIENTPSSLDPRVGTDQSSQRIHQLLYRGLLKRERNGNLSPDLAEKYWRQGNKSFIFKLKKRVKFSNGEEITPEDVAYTYNSLLSGKIRSIRKGALWMIEKVWAREGKVEFDLKEPYSSFPINATLGIVPKGSGQDFGEKPVSSGAYYLADRESEKFILKPNPYQKGVKNNGIIIRIIPDEVTRALELERGGVDLIVNGFTPDVLEELKRRKDLSIKIGRGGNFAYIGINFQDKILRKKEVRLAIGYAINRKGLIKNLMRGWARPANSILPSYLWASEPDVFRFSYNLSRAKELLERAGEKGIKLGFRCASMRLSRELSQILKDQLSRIGITLKIHCSEFSSFYSQIVKGNFQLYFLMWVGISDPDIFRYIFHSGSIPPNGANRGRYINPEMDKLIKEGETTYDMEERKKIYSKIQKIAAEDVVYIPLWYPDSVAIFRKGLKGVEIYPNGDLTFMKNVCH